MLITLWIHNNKAEELDEVLTGYYSAMAPLPPATVDLVNLDCGDAYRRTEIFSARAATPSYLRKTPENFTSDST